MIYGLLADAVVVVHVAFVLFVVGGGFLVLRHPWIAWLHVPAAVWGALIEVWGWICPLTPLEVRLREMAGGAGYGGGFIEQYLLPLLYPGDLTREVQIVLGIAVVVINGAVYGWIVYRSRKGTGRRVG